MPSIMPIQNDILYFYHQYRDEALSGYPFSKEITISAGEGTVSIYYIFPSQEEESEFSMSDQI
jgi:hypothetical protein